MTISRRSLRALVIALAFAAVSGAAVLLAHPQPIDSTVLGAEWECTQTAYVLTTCAPRPTPAVETSRKDAIRATRG